MPSQRSRADGLSALGVSLPGGAALLSQSLTIETSPERKLLGQEEPYLVAQKRTRVKVTVLSIGKLICERLQIRANCDKMVQKIVISGNCLQ